MNSVKICLSIDDPRLPGVVAALGLGGCSPAPTAPSVPAAGSASAHGLAVLDDHGAAIVADPRNASAAFLSALRLLATRSDVSEAELQAAAGSANLAGHKAAATKRVQRALGKRGAVLFRVEGGRVLMATDTRQALARHFGIVAP